MVAFSVVHGRGAGALCFDPLDIKILPFPACREVARIRLTCLREDHRTERRSHGCSSCHLRCPAIFVFLLKKHTLETYLFSEVVNSDAPARRPRISHDQEPKVCFRVQCFWLSTLPGRSVPRPQTADTIDLGPTGRAHTHGRRDANRKLASAGWTSGATQPLGVGAEKRRVAATAG